MDRLKKSYFASIPEMVVSIIIVNYNAKYFLEQCLCSVDRALDGVGAKQL